MKERFDFDAFDKRLADSLRDCTFSETVLSPKAFDAFIAHLAEDDNDE